MPGAPAWSWARARPPWCWKTGATARARGATILAELAGYGASSDHSHLVRPEAEGQVRAMRMALADAGLTPDAIGYVNAHGTATREGDRVEIDALRTVFGDRAGELRIARPNPCTAT